MATLGAIGTAITISGAAGLKFTPATIATAVSTSGLLGFVAAYLRGRSKLLPDSFVDEFGSEPSYKASLCPPAVLREACDLTRNSYGHEYVSHDVAEQWRLKNPRAFVQITNPDNRLCACFGVLALRQSFMDQFIAGRLTDLQLGGEDVCLWAESRESTRLYLSGVVVSNPSTFQGRKRARVMVWAMLEYMRQLYGLKISRRLYAVAVTEESSRLMTHLGFVVEMAAATRADKCDLYRYDLNETNWNTLLCRVGDLSPMCTCDFELHDDGTELTARQSSAPAPAAVARTQILFVAGDRGGSQRNQAQIPREFALIQEALRGCEHREAFSLGLPILGATRQSLVEAYRHEPTILHFSGHGDDRSLSFILDQGLLVSSTNVIAEQLAAILGAFPRRVSLCVLNTCESASIAAHLVQVGVVDAAIGWPYKVADDVAIAFSRALYGRLGDGLPLSKSVALAVQSCGAEDPPALSVGAGVDRDIVFLPQIDK